MNKCETCRFKAAERDWRLSTPEIRGMSHCVRIIHGNHMYARNAHKEPAAVVDGSGYAAALLVSEDFGCVLWEPKP